MNATHTPLLDAETTDVNKTHIITNGHDVNHVGVTKLYDVIKEFTSFSGRVQGKSVAFRYREIILSILLHPLDHLKMN